MLLECTSHKEQKQRAPHIVNLQPAKSNAYKFLPLIKSKQSYYSEKPPPRMKYGFIAIKELCRVCSVSPRGGSFMRSQHYLLSCSPE